jgi:hypothetical protein
VKTQDLRSDNNNACTLFRFWRRCFWRISFVIQVLSLMVVRVLLLQVVHHRDGVFVFFFLSFLFFFAVCICDVLYILLV